MRNKFVFLMVILSFLLILSPLSVKATPVTSTTYLSNSNFAISGTGPFASVTVTHDTTTVATIDFTIKLLDGLAGNGTTIGAFGFNSDQVLTFNDFSSVPSQWTQLDKNAAMDGFGKFSYVIGPKTNGQSNRVSGDQISFNIVGISSDIEDFINSNATDSHFALKVFPTSGVTGFISDGTDPVPTPEPATMLLFGTGLLGLTGLRKKFKDNYLI